MFDSHCHLDFYSHELADQLREGIAAGVGGWFVPGCNEKQWGALGALSTYTPGEERRIWVGVGLHPWWAESSKNVDALVSKMEVQIRNLGAVAIGECGLDKNRGGDLSHQVELLEAQMRLALHLNLPLVFHQVGAFESFLSALMRVGLPAAGGVVHGFGGDVYQAETLTRRGLLLGVGPAVLNATRRRLRDAISQVPLESWVLETDAPDQKPPGRSDRGRLRDLVAVRDEVADICRMDPDDVGKKTRRSARKLYRLSDM